MKQDTLAGELEQLAEKAFKPNPLEWYLPWRVVAESGKPTIAGSKSGNLFRGFIGTWQDADLVVALVNNLPTILAALRTDGEARDGVLADEQIKHMTERFLQWKLPADFHPDNGISAVRPNYAPGVPWEPVGTNLLDYTQAEAMVRHITEGLSTHDGEANSRAVPSGEVAERVAKALARADAEYESGGPVVMAAVHMHYWGALARAALSASKTDDASALLKAAIGLRDDLLNRAEWDGDAKVVVAGAGAWFRFNEAIDASIGRDGA